MSGYSFEPGPVAPSSHGLRSELIVYIQVYTLMPRKTGRTKQGVANRRGKALLVYFPDDAAARLQEVARERRVPKSELVRVAVGRFLRDLNSGQLELPLGV
jgi:hypothetical protein